MKIKRFLAADIRQALRQVKETLGPDAVILSNKPVSGGVELVAAMDYDETALIPPEPLPARSSEQVPAAEVTPIRSAPRAVSSNTPRPAPAVEAPVNPVRESKPPKIEWSQDPAIVEMRDEMQALRRLVENGLSGLSWNDMGQNNPELQELYRKLMALGLSPDLCQELITQVGAFENFDQAWRKALYFLAASIETTEPGILDHGGVVALVGPTGVGKTTTIAKLAARFALKHGHRQVALISADSYRIGAQEQLQTYAKILNVPVRSANSSEQLEEALHAFADKRLVLIDTAGMGPNDVRLTQQLALLNIQGRPISRFLVLSASTERTALEHAIKVFGKTSPEALILTKVDEAASLGGTFSAMIHNRKPLAFVTDGQRVPEDIHLAKPHTLVSKAVAIAEGQGEEFSDEYLSLALGGARVNAHG